jgi:hypothetical protein
MVQQSLMNDEKLRDFGVLAITELHMEAGGHARHSPNGTLQLDENDTHSARRGPMGGAKHAVGSQGRPCPTQYSASPSPRAWPRTTRSPSPT